LGLESGPGHLWDIWQAPASEACSLLPQFIVKLRSEFGEVLGANVVRLFSIKPSMGTLVTGSV